MGDAKELVACLKELVPRLPSGRDQSLGTELLAMALPKACDARTDGPRDRVCAMMAPLSDAGLLPPTEVQQLFRDSLEFLEDEVIDVPQIGAYYGRYLGAALGAKAIDFAFLVDALAPLVDAKLVKPDAELDGQGGAAWLFVTAAKALASASGEAACKALYEASKADVTATLPEDARNPKAAASLLAAAGVAFLDSRMVEGVKASEAAADAEALASQVAALDAHLRSGVLAPPADEAAGESWGGAASALSWIEAQCDAKALDTERCARAAMRAVLDSACVAGEAPDAKALCKQLERCAALLKKVNGSSAERTRIAKQAACLYEVQQFCGDKGWPSMLIKKLFYNLYETDTVFEDAFTLWREDTADATPGKDKALFQVNEFLQWLDAAEEDDGNDDDAEDEE